MQPRTKSVLNCLLCGKEGDILYSNLRDRLHNVPGEYEIRYCRSCNLAWLDPQPVEEDLHLCYPNGYYTHSPATSQNQKESASHTSVRQRIRHSILNQWYGYEYRYSSGNWYDFLGFILGIIPFFRKRAYYDLKIRIPWQGGGRLLDVGCGNGSFLLSMRELGWEVEGVEIDIRAAEAARQKGLNVRIGTLESLSFPSETFDAITMIHVIEHLPDPVKTLKECYRIIKPGGYIGIITPNIKSLLHKRFGNSWVALDPPRHLFLHTTQSLKKVVSNSGFNITGIFTRHEKYIFDFCYEMSIKIMNKTYIKRRSYLPTFLEKYVLKYLEITTSNLLGIGEEILILSRK